MTWPRRTILPEGKYEFRAFLTNPLKRQGRRDQQKTRRPVDPVSGLSQVRGCFLSPHQVWPGASRTIGFLKLRILDFTAFTASCPTDDYWGRAISDVT